MKVISYLFCWEGPILYNISYILHFYCSIKNMQNSTEIAQQLTSLFVDLPVQVQTDDNIKGFDRSTGGITSRPLRNFNRPTDQPTDGHEGSYASCTSNNNSNPTKKK